MSNFGADQGEEQPNCRAGANCLREVAFDRGSIASDSVDRSRSVGGPRPAVRSRRPVRASPSAAGAQGLRPAAPWISVRRKSRPLAADVDPLLRIRGEELLHPVAKAIVESDRIFRRGRGADGRAGGGAGGEERQQQPGGAAAIHIPPPRGHLSILPNPCPGDPAAAGLADSPALLTAAHRRALRKGAHRMPYLRLTAAMLSGRLQMR